MQFIIYANSHHNLEPSRLTGKPALASLPGADTITYTDSSPDNADDAIRSIKEQQAPFWLMNCAALGMGKIENFLNKFEQNGILGLLRGFEIMDEVDMLSRFAKSCDVFEYNPAKLQKFIQDLGHVSSLPTWINVLGQSVVNKCNTQAYFNIGAKLMTTTLYHAVAEPGCGFRSTPQMIIDTYGQHYEYWRAGGGQMYGPIVQFWNQNECNLERVSLKQSLEIATGFDAIYKPDVTALYVWDDDSGSTEMLSNSQELLDVAKGYVAARKSSGVIPPPPPQSNLPLESISGSVFSPYDQNIHDEDTWFDGVVWDVDFAQHMQVEAIVFNTRGIFTRITLDGEQVYKRSSDFYPNNKGEISPLITMITVPAGKHKLVAQFCKQGGAEGAVQATFKAWPV